MIQIQIQILDYIQCSPVDSSTVVVVLKHFWGQVLWRSAEGLKRRTNNLVMKVKIINKMQSIIYWIHLPVFVFVPPMSLSLSSPRKDKT